MSHCSTLRIACSAAYSDPVPTERAIREKLASDLTVLEDRITLVKREYPLPNAHGTRGYIDILARDRFGNFVVVELKRSNHAASRALHELFKYAGLLAREKGLDRFAVRCMLVSTDWDELRVPFSLLLTTFPYDTVGLVIDVDDAGAVVSVETMEPLEEVEPLGVTPVHHLYFFKAADAREAAWSDISAILSGVGSPDHVALAIDRQLPFDGWTHALYLVVVMSDRSQSVSGSNNVDSFRLFAHANACARHAGVRDRQPRAQKRG
jgi:hypothetical protein